MRRGHHWIAAGGRRTLHLQHVLPSLEAWIVGGWVSFVNRVACHRRGRVRCTTESESDLAHRLTPLTPPRDYRGSWETLASSDSSDVEIGGMHSPDCPPCWQGAGSLGYYPSFGSVPQHNETVKPKNRRQEPLVPRHDGAGC
jgi:hypothetical protein